LQFSLGLAGAGDVRPPVAEEIKLFPAPAARVTFRTWNMNRELHEGRILLNTDHKAAPWAGMIFQPKEKAKALLILTPQWISKGFVEFQINGLGDRYGRVGSPCLFQLRLIGCTSRYERIPARFYEGERGIDADASTWQEVLVPIKLFNVKPGGRVTAVGLQCVGRPLSSFGVANVSLVRFEKPLARDAARAEMQVAQPWVAWPAYEELPDTLKLPRNMPLLRNGKFVTKDGRRTFLIMPWGREDQKGALGINAAGKICPDFGLYDKRTQAFIYERPLDARAMSRLGFNCYAGQVDPRPFSNAIGYAGRHGSRLTHEGFLEHVRGMGYPFYVDMVCFPWTLGKPAADKNAKLPPGVLHDGHHHWTPYRIIGKGRDVWLTMWTTYARRYKDAGARVLFYELMNEPAYLATTPDHRGEFVAWLKRRYGTLVRVNGTWGTNYKSWDGVRNFKRVNECTGVFFDYDEYLGDRFADLVRAGCEAIEKITPGVAAAVQTMGGYTLQPRHAIYLSKLIPIQRAVLAPTGGGRWTRAIPNAAPRPNTVDYAIGPSPIANDLLLAMAGEKMIVDNEMYLGPGQTRLDMRNRWWRAVIAGIDGAAWFSWSKRGWAWWRGRENILREADLFPFSGLIPFARRAAAIRGVLEFAEEIELVREFVLPKPWGPEPRIGMLYSWANARWRLWEPKLRDRTGNYHAAMRYLHWNFNMVPSHTATPERLAKYELLIAGGMDHIEPELLENLTEFVARGGKLIVADGLMGRDLYGQKLDPTPLLGVRAKGRRRVSPDSFKVVGLPKLDRLPGEVSRAAALIDIDPVPPTETLWRDTEGRPVVTRRPLGKGEVYFVAADLRGYPLARLLAILRQRVGLPRSLLITDGRTGQLAPNVLVSRRSQPTHHALLLLNADPFPKLVRIRVIDLAGDWEVSDPLEGRVFQGQPGVLRWRAQAIGKQGILYCIRGNGRGLVLLTRKPWHRTTLMPTNPGMTIALYENELASWRKKR